MDALLEMILTGLVAILEPVLTCVGYFFLELLVRVVAAPVFCVVFTPVVLIGACFGPGRYAEKVISTYKEFAVGFLMYG